MSAAAYTVLRALCATNTRLAVESGRQIIIWHRPHEALAAVACRVLDDAQLNFGEALARADVLRRRLQKWSDQLTAPGRRRRQWEPTLRAPGVRRGENRCEVCGGPVDTPNERRCLLDEAALAMALILPDDDAEALLLRGRTHEEPA